MDLKIEQKRAIESGDVRIAKFSGAQRNLEATFLEEGDKFTLPESYEVYKQNLNDRDVQYIFIQTAEGKVKRLYPSTFTKAVNVVNEDKSLTGVRVHTQGSAAELYRQYATVAEGMEALRGKTLEVTKVDTYRSIRPGTTEIMNTRIPTIDIVEVEKK